MKVTRNIQNTKLVCKLDPIPTETASAQKLVTYIQVDSKNRRPYDSLIFWHIVAFS